MLLLCDACSSGSGAAGLVLDSAFDLESWAGEEGALSSVSMASKQFHVIEVLWGKDKIGASRRLERN